MAELSRQEKAARFRTQASELLTQEEQLRVKTALAQFMKSKAVDPLALALREVLDNAERSVLFDTIGLFIPQKYKGEYGRLTKLNLAEYDSWEDAVANKPSTSGGDAVEAEARARAEEMEARVQAGVAAEVKKQQEAAERAAAEALAQKGAAAKAEAEAERMMAEAARIMQEAEEKKARAERITQEAEAAVAADADRRATAEREAAEAEEKAASDRQAAANAEAAEKARRAAAEVQVTNQTAAAAEEEAKESNQAAVGGDAPAPAKDEAGGEEAPAETEAQRAQRERAEENARALAARKKRRERLDRIAKQQAEEDAKRGVQEDTPFSRSQRGTVRGKSGGVSKLKSRWAQAGAKSAEVQTGGSGDSPKLRPKLASGRVANMRNSVLEAAARASREITRLDKVILAEQQHGTKFGGKLVFYLTTVTGIAATKHECLTLRKIFQRLRVAFEERNIYMSKEIAVELKERLPGKTVPQVCFNGEYLGDYTKVFKMNETGELQDLVKRMKKLEVGIEAECEGCGGSGFIVCPWCGGDKKSMGVNIGKGQTGSVAHLKCTACNENGLTACQECMITEADFEV